MNTTATLKSYEGTVPALPALGRVLSGLNFTFDIPRLRLPGNVGEGPDGDRPHFIRDATVLFPLLFSIINSRDQQDPVLSAS